MAVERGAVSRRDATQGPGRCLFRIAPVCRSIRRRPKPPPIAAAPPAATNGRLVPSAVRSPSAVPGFAATNGARSRPASNDRSCGRRGIRLSATVLATSLRSPALLAAWRLSFLAAARPRPLADFAASFRRHWLSHRERLFSQRERPADWPRHRQDSPVWQCRRRVRRRGMKALQDRPEPEDRRCLISRRGIQSERGEP